jgi:GlcNAc-P-P-Und epimerase
MIGGIGGSGFIGTLLVRALRASGHSVRIIDRARSAAFPDLHVEADVRDPKGLAAAGAGCTALYNLAAEHNDNVQPRPLYHDVNLGGAQHVCAVTQDRGGFRPAKARQHLRPCSFRLRAAAT